MELNEFVADCLIEKHWDLDKLDKTISAVKDYAKTKAVNNCAILTDEDVKNFVMNLTEENLKDAPVELPKPSTKKTEPKPEPKPKKEKKEEIEMVALF